MAKFHVCTDNQGATLDCRLSFSEAVSIVRSAGGGEVVSLNVVVNAKNVARLLGGLGGYSRGDAVITKVGDENEHSETV